MKCLLCERFLSGWLVYCLRPLYYYNDVTLQNLSIKSLDISIIVSSSYYINNNNMVFHCNNSNDCCANNPSTITSESSCVLLNKKYIFQLLYGNCIPFIFFKYQYWYLYSIIEINCGGPVIIRIVGAPSISTSFFYQLKKKFLATKLY